MAVFINPKSGERYENVPDAEAEIAQAKFGLVPIEQFEAEQAEAAKPLVQKAGEAVEAAGNVPLRALEAVSEALPGGGGMADANKRLAGTWSPSDERARAIAEAHPVATAVGQAVTEAPAAIVGGIPGAALRVGQAALQGSAESSFAEGAGYVPNLDDALFYGGLQLVFEGAVPGARKLKSLLQTESSAVEQSVKRGKAKITEVFKDPDPIVRADSLVAHAEDVAEKLGEQAATTAQSLTKETGKFLKGALGTLSKEGAADASVIESVLDRIGDQTLREGLEATETGAALLKRYDALAESGLSGSTFRTIREFQEVAEQKAGNVAAWLTGSPQNRQALGDAINALEGASGVLNATGAKTAGRSLRSAAQVARTLLDQYDELAESVATKGIREAATAGVKKAAKDRAESVTAKLGKQLLSKYGPAIATGMGGAAFGPLGAAAAGMAAERIVKSGGFMRALEAPLQKLAGFAAREQSQTARALVTPRFVGLRGALGTVERGAPLAGIGAGAAWRAFSGGEEDHRAAWAASRDVVEQSDAEMTEALGTQFGDVAEQYPDLFDGIVQHAFKTREFLRSKLPGASNPTLMNPNGIPPDRHAVRKWALYYSAAMAPATAFEDLRSGRGRIEQVETLKALYPQRYGALRNEIVTAIAAGARPTVSQRARLSLLFDLGGELDPLFSTTVAGAADRARQARAQPPPPASSVPGSATGKGPAERYASPARTMEAPAS